MLFVLLFGMGDIVHDVQMMNDKWHSARTYIVDDLIYHESESCKMETVEHKERCLT